MTIAEVSALITQLWTRVGNDRVTDADLRTVGFAILELIGQTETASIIPAWAAGLTFQTDGSDEGEYARHAASTGAIRLWKTKQDNNIGHEPPTDPGITEDAWWIEVSPSSGSALQEWSAGIYGTGLIIVFHNHSVDGNGLYKLEEPVRPFESTNIETEITAGSWSRLTKAPGTVRLMGNYDASVDQFPNSGGSGLGGAIEKGNEWDISVAGTLGGEEVPAGATIRAKVDNPGDVLADWRIYY